MRAPHRKDLAIFSQPGVVDTLGEVDQWPDELRCWSSDLLQSDEPMFLVWGREMTVLFNDAYRIAMKFPDYARLGVSLPLLCGDLWPFVEPFVQDAFSGGAGHLYNREFRTTAIGEEGVLNFSLSYSPIRDATGSAVLGVACVLMGSDPVRPVVAPVRHPVQLTARQRECLSWVIEGKSSAAIAEILGISAYTVDEHISEACRKLGVRSRVQAAVVASSEGLLTPT